MLMQALKGIAKRNLQRMGYEIVYSPAAKKVFTGFDFRRDVKLFVNQNSPICFDVGANEGQTIALFQDIFNEPRVYSFEPSREIFHTLESKTFGKNVSIFNLALGNAISQKELINYTNSRLSSFLKLNSEEDSFFGEVSIVNREVVDVTTIDDFVIKHAISKIHLLKIDTQGFDLNVLLGGVNSFENGLIDNVLVELNFIDLYESQDNPYSLSEFLMKYNFRLVDYYEKVYKDNILAWCNALFTRGKS